MAIKVNDFIIQAKVKEDAPLKFAEASPAGEASSGSSVPDSVKQEIIDECMERLNELVEEKLKA
ncbi:MAG TPA: hypothetical protein DCX14_14945 [Flavobacteriales bacterium]|jgi:hypothetical protein|nr:hypothetical protein [Flavobacteriales bacterium]HAW21477.1 hypothetical protein [Flavobacteriales bacterium]